MSHKTIRIAGKSYVILAFTPKTTERVIKSIRGFNVQELKDIPEGNRILANTISIAISGSGILRRFKTFFIGNRLVHHANIETLLEVTGAIIEMIPTREYYALTSLTNNFQKIITK